MQTSGPSMEPTLQTNNLLITERVSKRLNRIDRGDIVIAKSPIEPNIMICKRVGMCQFKSYCGNHVRNL